MDHTVLFYTLIAGAFICFYTRLVYVWKEIKSLLSRYYGLNLKSVQVYSLLTG